MSDVHKDHKGSEVGLNMGYSVIVEKQPIVESRPFEIRLTENIEALLAKEIGANAKGPDIVSNGIKFGMQFIHTHLRVSYHPSCSARSASLKPTSRLR